MRRTQRWIAMVMAGLMLSGCYGPFYLTRKIYNWNGQVGDKWVNEIVFLVCTWLPVYGLASAADAIIFNSIEFWTGKNPLTMADAGKDVHIVRGDSEAVMSYDPKSQAMQIQQFKDGHAAPGLTVRHLDGMTVATDPEGHTLFTAQTKADGSVVVHDAQGKEIASYSAEHIKHARAAIAK